jgi:hypothetical protein
MIGKYTLRINSHQRARVDCAPGMSPHLSNRAVITRTGLDIHRYICNALVRRHDPAKAMNVQNSSFHFSGARLRLN